MILLAAVEQFVFCCYPRFQIPLAYLAVALLLGGCTAQSRSAVGVVGQALRLPGGRRAGDAPALQLLRRWTCYRNRNESARETPHFFRSICLITVLAIAAMLV